jgi:hypothetical protein
MAIVTDFLAHGSEEFFALWGDGATGYYGQVFEAQASDLTRIEFELDPVLGSGAGPADYTVLVASVKFDDDGNFVRPDQVLFESAPLSFTPDGAAFDWQHVSVGVAELSLTPGQTYIFLLNANYGGNAAGGDARVAATGDQTLPGDPEGFAVFSPGNRGSTAADFALNTWFNFFPPGADLAYRLTYAGGDNSAPTAIDDNFAATQGTVLTVIAADGVLENDEDPDGDALTVTGVTVDGVPGTIGSTLAGDWGDLILEDDGGFSYTRMPGSSRSRRPRIRRSTRSNTRSTTAVAARRSARSRSRSRRPASSGPAPTRATPRPEQRVMMC